MIKSRAKGNLIVLSGPSGAGKDSIIRGLLEKNSNIWLSISMTSRLPRGEEKDEIDYYFVTKEEFKNRINNDELLEYAEYNGNYYGTPKASINEKLDSGKDVILEIEIQGALKIKEMIPDTLFIFILPPSMKELKKRLEVRGTESEEKILKRFKRAYEEINEVTKYNYVVINDDLDIATDKVNAILLSERCRVDRIEEIYTGTLEEELHEQLLPNKSFPDDTPKIQE